jgi:hypothetical protein
MYKTSTDYGYKPPKQALGTNSAKHKTKAASRKIQYAAFFIVETPITKANNLNTLKGTMGSL